MNASMEAWESSRAECLQAIADPSSNKNKGNILSAIARADDMIAHFRRLMAAFAERHQLN